MVLFFADRNRGKKAAAILILAAIMVFVCSLIACTGRETIKATATADEVGVYSTSAESTEEIEKFLAVFGIDADMESEESDTVRIPLEFNEAYSNYNKLQQKIGLDLSPFKGENVRRLIYKLKDKEKQVTLLVFRKHIIGGHICSGVYGEEYKDLLSEKNGKTG